jgi:hypothetical protein
MHFEIAGLKVTVHGPGGGNGTGIDQTWGGGVGANPAATGDSGAASPSGQALRGWAGRFTASISRHWKANISAKTTRAAEA